MELTADGNIIACYSEEAYGKKTRFTFFCFDHKRETVSPSVCPEFLNISAKCRDWSRLGKRVRLMKTWQLRSGAHGWSREGAGPRN